MKKKILVILTVIIVLIFAYCIYYLTDFYPADSTAKSYTNGSENVTVIKTSNGLLIDGSGNDTALIFYPGAKVEFTAYLPLLSKIASNGVDCFLVEMPFNLAFLGKNSANEIIDNYNYTKYYLSGHSLGGVIASQYVHETNRTDGLILFEAYPTDEIEKPVLSIYGSEDKVLNKEKYDESKVFMKNLTEIIINGGNHAQIGNYGNQTGDGVAKISSSEQQKECVDAIFEFLNQYN